jgi:hypothetical protein
MRLSFAPDDDSSILDEDGVMCSAVSVELDFESWIPSKKNQLMRRRGAGSGMMYTDDVKKALQDLQLQAKVQWGLRPRIRHPQLEFRIDAQSSQDRDGIVTTLLDVLKRAGVIEDDSIARCNGLMMIFPAGTADPGRTKAKVTVLWKKFATNAVSPTPR